MKETVVLVSNNEQTIIGYASIDQDVPGIPEALVWKNRPFIYQPGFGGGTPTYKEAISQHLEDDDVSLTSAAAK